MEIDLLADVAPASNKEIGALADLAQKMVDLENQIERDEELLKQKKQNLRMLAEHDIPDMMQELNMRSFELTNGFSLEVKPIIQATIPSSGAIERAKEESVRAELIVLQQQCFNWLRENGGADLIKSAVEVKFGRGEEQDCKNFTDQLRDHNLNYKQATAVHPQTLNGFIKERMEAGKDVPMELFRVFTGRRANIKKG
jgi:hypothetical protein